MDLTDASANLLALEQLVSDTALSIYCPGDNSSQVSSSVVNATSLGQPSTSIVRSSPNCPSVDTLSCTFFRELELGAVAPSVLDSKEESPFLPPFLECKSSHNSEMQQSEASVEQQNTADEKPSSKDDSLSESDSRPAWSPERTDGLHLSDVGRRCKQLHKPYILAVESVPKLSKTQAVVSPARNMEQMLSATAEHKIPDIGLASKPALSSSYKMLYSDLELSDDSDQDSTDDNSSCIAPDADWNAISNMTPSGDDQSARVLGKWKGDHVDEIGSSSQDNKFEGKNDEIHCKGGNAEGNGPCQSGSSVGKKTSSDVLNVSVTTDLLSNASLDSDEACLNSGSSQSSNGSKHEQNNDSDASDASEHMPYSNKYDCSDGLSCGSNNAFLDSGVSSCSSITSPVNDMQEMLFDGSSVAISLLTEEGYVRQSQECQVPNRKSCLTDLDHTSLSPPLLGLAEQPVKSSSTICNESQVCGSGRDAPVMAKLHDSVVKASFNSKALSAAETYVKGEKHGPSAKTNGIKLQRSNMTPKDRAHLSKPNVNTYQNSIFDLMCTRTKRGKRRNYSIIPSEPKNIAGEMSQDYSRDTAAHCSSKLMGSKTVTGTFSAAISAVRAPKDKNLATKRALDAIATIDVRGKKINELDAIKESSSCFKMLSDKKLDLHTSKMMRKADADVSVSRDNTDNLLGHIEERLDVKAEDVIDINYPISYVSNTTYCKQDFVEKRLDKEVRIAEENNFLISNCSRETTGCIEDPIEKKLELKTKEIEEDNGPKFTAIRADGSQDSNTSNSNLDQGVDFNPVSEDCTSPESFECTAINSFEGRARGHCDRKNESVQISQVLPKLAKKCFSKFRYTFSPVIDNPAEGGKSMTKDDVKEGSSSSNSNSNEDQRGTVTALKQSAGKMTQSYTEEMPDERPLYFSPKNNLNETMKSHTNLFKTQPSCVSSAPMAAADTSLVSKSLSLGSENCAGPQINCKSAATEQRPSGQPLNNRPTAVDKRLHSGRSVNERKIIQVTGNVYTTEMYDIMCTRNKRGRKKQIIKIPVKLNIDDVALDKAINKDPLPVKSEADRQNVDVDSLKDISHVEPDGTDSTNISQVRGSDKICGSWQREKAKTGCDGVLENPIKTRVENNSFTKFGELRKMGGSEIAKDTSQVNHSIFSASSTQLNQSSFPTSNFGNSKSTPNKAIQCMLPTITLPGSQPFIGDYEPCGALSSSSNSAGAESQDAAPLHLANQAGEPRPNISKPDANEDRGDNCKISTLSAGLESAPLTKSQACVVTDSKPVMDESDESDLERNSGRELKRHSYELRARQRKSYADHSPEWESNPHDIDLSKKTCPKSKRVPNFKPSKKLCTRKANMKTSGQSSKFCSNENAFDSTSLKSLPFSKYEAQKRASDCTSKLVFGSFDLAVSLSSHGSPSDRADIGNRGKVEGRMKDSDYAGKSLEVSRHNYFADVIPALGLGESSDRSGRSTDILKNFSSGVVWKFLPPIKELSQLKRAECSPAVPTSTSTEQSGLLTPSSQEQPVLCTLTSRDQPVLPTTASQEQPVFPTTSSQEQPVLTTPSSLEQPVLSTTSSKEKSVFSSTLSQEQIALSTIVRSEQRALFSTSIKELPILPKTPNTETSVVHIASHNEQEYFTSTLDTEQSAVPSCPERAEFPIMRAKNPCHYNLNFPIMSSSEQPALQTTLNSKLPTIVNSVNQEQTTYSASSNEGNAVQPIVSNEEPSIPSTASIKEENILIARRIVPSQISTSSYERPALHVSPSKEELALSGKLHASQRSSDLNRGLVSLNDQTAASTFSCSSHVLCSPKGTSSIYHASNPQTLFSTNVNQSEINDILMPSQILQPSINLLENSLLPGLPLQLKCDSVLGSTGSALIFDETVKTPKSNPSSANTNVVNILSNSRFTHLSSISSPTHSCEDVMDVLLPKGYAIVKLDDDGEPCDVVQSILAKMKSRFRKHCNCLGDEAGSYRTEPSVEVINSGNVTPPCAPRTSCKSYSTGCNEDVANLFNVSSSAVGNPSSAGKVSQLGLTANEPQNNIADTVNFLEPSLSTVGGGFVANADTNLVTMHDSGTPVADQNLLFQFSHTGSLSHTPIGERTIDEEMRVCEVLRSEASPSEAAEATPSKAASATSYTLSDETHGNMPTVTSDDIPIHDSHCVTTRANAGNSSTPDVATTGRTSEVATANRGAPKASPTILTSVDAAANDRTPKIAETDSSKRTAANGKTLNSIDVATNVVGTVASNSVAQEVPPIHMQEATVANVHSSDASKDVFLEASETNSDELCASFSDEGDDLFMAVIIDSDDSIYEFDESSKEASAEDNSTDTSNSTGDSLSDERELNCSTVASKFNATQTAENNVHKGRSFDVNLRNLMLNFANHAPIKTSTSTEKTEKMSLKEPKSSKGNKRTAGCRSRAPRGRKRKFGVHNFEACLERPTKKTKQQRVST